MCDKCTKCENFKEKKTEQHKNMTEVRPLTWQKAMDWASSLGEDWVLPSRWQLQIMYRAKELGHPDLQDMNDKCFWSSDTVAINSSNAWYVYFSNGYVSCYNKTSTYYVRCVRKAFLDSLILWILKNEKEHVNK